MKVRIIYLFALIFFISFSSCNLVEHAEKSSVKKLERNEINEYFIAKDSFNLHGYYGGSGPVLVFIHGFGGDAQLSWKQTLIDYFKNYTVLAMDLLWFGKSNAKVEANLNAQAQALNIFIEELIPDIDSLKCTLIGHSYGGFVTIAYREKYDHVSKMVIIDSPGMTYDTDKLYELEKMAKVENYWDLFVLQKPEHILRLNEMAFLKPPKVPGFVLDDIYQKYFTNHHSQLKNLLTSLPVEKEKYLNSNKELIPTLIIWGEHDKIFPLEEGQKLAVHLKAKFEVIPETGHSAPFENYELFKAILNAFLEGK